MSMHAAMGCVLIRLFTFQKPPAIQRRNALLIAGGLISFVIYHCVTDEFVLHVILFFSMSGTVGWKTHKVIQSRPNNEAYKSKLSSLITFALCESCRAKGLLRLDSGRMLR